MNAVFNYFLTGILMLIPAVYFAQSNHKGTRQGKQESPIFQDSTRVDLLIDSAVRITTANPKKAIQLLQKAGDLAGELEYGKGTAVSYLQMAKIYNTHRDYEKAQEYASQGMATANKFELDTLKKPFFMLLSEIQYDKNHQEPDTTIREEVRDMVAAIKYKYYLKDSLDKSVEKANFLEQDMQNKENELVVFRLQTVLFGIGFVAVLIFIGFGVMWINVRKIKMENKQLLTEQKLKRSQMNPHFIFNSIQNVRSLIHGKKEEAAIEYLNRFSSLTRQVLESSNENYISLTEETEILRNYLSIQQLLYGNMFDFSISVPENMDTDAFFIPPMLAQPFVENAIKHGLAGKQQGGRISVRFLLQGKKLFFEVKDNGVGFSASKQAENHKSMAMSITKERLSHYSKTTHFKFQAGDIRDENQQVRGAKVLFEIPYIYEN